MTDPLFLNKGIVSAIQKNPNNPDIKGKYSYEYLTLNQVSTLSNAEQINLYGVVLLQEPASAYQHLFSWVVFLIDPSFDRKLKVTLIFPAMEDIPSVETGDILRLHRLNIVNRNIIGDPESHSQYLVIKNRDAVPQSVTTTCTWTPEDVERSKVLKLWWSAISDSFPLPMASNSRNVGHSGMVWRTLDQIHDDRSTFNIVCQIIDVGTMQGERARERVELVVWDGSGINQEPKAPSEQDQKTLEQSNGYFHPASPRGFTMTLMVWAPHTVFFKGLPKSLLVGQWLEIGGAQGQEHEGRQELKMGGALRSFRIIHERSPKVLELLNNYKNSLEQIVAPETYSLLAPKLDRIRKLQPIMVATRNQHLEMPFSSIVDVYNTPSGPGIWRVLLQVEMNSLNVSTMTSCWCASCESISKTPQCSKCSKSTFEHVYAFTMILTDGKTQIKAKLYRRDGEMFFPDVPPVALIDDSPERRKLEEKVKKMFQKDVFLDCTLKSYVSKNIRKYRITDTEFIG